MKRLLPLLLFVSSFAILDGINFLFGRIFNQFGLVPRSFDHLYGIFTSPWLHANFSHSLTNLTALAFFCPLLWQWGSKNFWKVSLFIIVTSGLLVWVFGRQALHIGASGLVYGYFGFCLIGGWLSRKLLLIFLSLLVAVLYGSMIFGVLPIHAGISFEYHLFGFLMGLIAAKLWAGSINQNNRSY